ncbi:hypothetical protein H0H93_004906 [Arthromyces matolae]|nr:hypothetical protein H0H93_004906 [Arthromyces matolae]
MRAYYYDNLATDQRLPHDLVPSQLVLDDKLAALGVKSWTFPLECHEKQIDRICTEEGYTCGDIFVMSKEVLGEEVYMKTLKGYFEEHFHERDEVLYFLAGGAYYDVRVYDSETPSDAWIRIAIDTTDLIAIPNGIYHRFTLDERDGIKVIPLYKVAPQQIDIMRGEETEIHPSRIRYLEKIGFGN